jgi:D-sedoheptulose 7-phosphate isomerase
MRELPQPLTPAGYFGHLSALLTQLDLESITAVAEVLLRTYREDRQVFLAGNGGSAATASHMALDLSKSVSSGTACRGLKARALTDHPGMLTAVGNDLSFDEIFRYPLATYSSPGDLFIALSCSGESRNILRAAQWARQHDLLVVALTGFDGGTLGTFANWHIHVPTPYYGPGEDLHLMIGHCWCESLRAGMARSDASYSEPEANQPQ